MQHSLPILTSKTSLNQNKTKMLSFVSGESLLRFFWNFYLLFLLTTDSTGANCSSDSTLGLANTLIENTQNRESQSLWSAPPHAYQSLMKQKFSTRPAPILPGAQVHFYWHGIKKTRVTRQVNITTTTPRNLRERSLSPSISFCRKHSIGNGKSKWNGMAAVRLLLWPPQIQLDLMIYHAIWLYKTMEGLGRSQTSWLRLEAAISFWPIVSIYKCF